MIRSANQEKKLPPVAANASPGTIGQSINQRLENEKKEQDAIIESCNDEDERKTKVWQGDIQKNASQVKKPVHAVKLDDQRDVTMSDQQQKRAKKKGKRNRASQNEKPVKVKMLGNQKRTFSTQSKHSKEDTKNSEDSPAKGQKIEPQQQSC